jgi:hypothetical protein
MWIKKGLVFDVAEHASDLIKSHASIPFSLHLEGNRFRIFFSARNERGQSLPYFVNATIENGTITIENEISAPILPLGEAGTFDDSGIMPSCLVKKDGLIYLYYIGWNPQVNVSYRLSIGLAISRDNGLTFEKAFKGPICDRSMEEPFFNTAPFVICDQNQWKMWYISCTAWRTINNYPEPQYHIKYAESHDGIHWDRGKVICLDYDEVSEALGRPCVYRKDNAYEMYFSYRKLTDYRTTKFAGYQIGFARSNNGKDWTKLYDQANIALSEHGWDSQMMEYCHVFEHDQVWYMLYNGNDFGKQGFGYATRP